MRTKILKKVFAFGTTAAIVACLPQFSVGAASNTYNKRLLGNLSQCTFQYGTTYGAKYGRITDSAVKRWDGDYQAFTMNWSKKNQGNYTAAFITANLADNEDGPPYADTIWCNAYSKNLNPDLHDWTHCVVRINNKYYTVLSSTITHEIGHVLGLKHRNTVPDSIMCQRGKGRTATSPSDFDKALVTMKYYNQ